MSLLQNIDASKASDQDRISGKMLKATATSIAAPVTKMFTVSIQLASYSLTMYTWSNIVPFLPRHPHEFTLLSVEL